MQKYIIISKFQNIKGLLIQLKNEITILAAKIEKKFNRFGGLWEKALL